MSWDWCSAHLAGAGRTHDEDPKFTHVEDLLYVAFLCESGQKALRLKSCGVAQSLLIQLQKTFG